MATIRASEQGLKIIDSKRKTMGWNKDAFLWLSEAGHHCGSISRSTLQRFWRQERIRHENFVAICKAVGQDKWEEIVDDAAGQDISGDIEFFAYNDCWVGRESTIAQLKEKVQGSCRILILVGIAGIGKTALAERLALELQENFLQGNWNNFLRENFDEETQSQDFVSVGAQWLEKWGEPLTQEDRQTPQKLLERLVKHLRFNQRLVLMDSLEKILQGNAEEGWSNFKDNWWVKFFKSVLTAESFLSRIIFTSQELPGQVEEEGTRYQNFWHRQLLDGLTDLERLALFEKTGLKTEPDSHERRYLSRIGSAYEGHPLALWVIAGEIGNLPFYGNIKAYWNKYGSEIEEVERATEEAKVKGIISGADDSWRLHTYTSELRRNVKKRLETTFSRLLEDAKYAYILLCEGSVYRCAVSENFWLGHLEYWDYNKDKQAMALDILRDRYLVEEVLENNQYLLRQHNLIRSVSLERLKKLGEDYE